MYVHLNKKINVPNCSKVKSISWSSAYDFIACGGDNGVLKVIKLENNLNSPTGKGDAKSFTHNQALESHKSTVQYVCWNEKYQKLTSSDESGSIIVWMFYNGMWYEEMINNRNKSLVTGMAWTFDGQKICIVYDDGAIITGSVEGTRIWGKDVKNANLTKVEWSPDGKTILIGTNELELQIYDSSGNFVQKIPLSSLQTMFGRSSIYKENSNLISIKWFKNQPINHPLLIAIEDGWLQLMKNESDDFPLLVNIEMKISSVEWNHTGEMFAVTGNGQVDEGISKNLLKLYNNEGVLLQTVKVPGNEIFDCSWDRTSLKLALAVDSYMFFASVKPNHHWGYMGNSIVFALPSSSIANKKKLVFYYLKTNAPYEKEVNNFCQLTTWIHCCAVVTKSDDSFHHENKKSEIYHLTLYNSTGTLIDRQLVNMKVNYCCLNSTRLIVASDDSFVVWQFNSPFKNHKNNFSDKLLNELTLQVDPVEAKGALSVTLISRNDPIYCLAASDKSFVIAHKSGTIRQFLLPDTTQVHQIQADCIPQSLALNRNSSKFSLIDKAAKLHIYDFDATNEDTSSEGDWLDVKVQDVWDMRWAADNNATLAICEKNRLTIVNCAKLEREDAVLFNGYMCSFEQLTVKAILLNKLMVDYSENKSFQASTYFEDFESQTIRELKVIMSHSLTDAVNYALQWPTFPCLWNIISQYSLANLQLETANLAFVKCKDYKGIQFVKRLNKLNDDFLKRSETYAFLGKFENAERIYIDQNRPELAIHLNKLLGNYQRVIELLEKYPIADAQVEMESARKNLGQYYADHCEWMKAVEHLEKVNAVDQLVPCYIHLGNYHALVLLVERVQNDTLLTDIGIYLQSMGLCKESVRALVKANKVEHAVRVCIDMGEWKLAIDLAHQHRIEHIDSILAQYVQHLLAQHKYVEIIEVYRKANKISDATDMTMKLIGRLKAAYKGDATLLKKLFVLIGLLFQENKLKTNKTSANSALDDLLSTDEVIPLNVEQKMVEDPWKGAEAYHFFLLTQRHLYEGYFDLAMKTALHLQDYEEFLSLEEIYSLIVLASYSCKCFSVCSKAFIKLEAINGETEPVWDFTVVDSDSNSVQAKVSQEKRETYEKLAVAIFASNPPHEQQTSLVVRVDCKFCGSSIADYSTSCNKCNTKFLPCIASGKSIMDSRLQWTCKQCLHQAIKTEITQFNNCPLCHFHID